MSTGRELLEMQISGILFHMLIFGRSEQGYNNMYFSKESR